MPNSLKTILLLSHAHSDLLMLAKIKDSLPDGFSNVFGIDLQQHESSKKFEKDLRTHLTKASVVVMRVLGDSGSVPAMAEIMKFCKTKQVPLIVISGAGEPNADLACLSTVDSETLETSRLYFAGGGQSNLVQSLLFLSDRLLLTNYGYLEPQELPNHGFYSKENNEPETQLDRLRDKRHLGIVGIVFYRAHWLCGNTNFIDELVSALAEHNIGAIVVYTASLRAIDESSGLPFAYAMLQQCGIKCDAIINTTSFSTTDSNNYSKSASAFDSTDSVVPVFQAMTSTMTRLQWQDSNRGLSPLDTAMNVVLPEFDGRIITHPICFRSNNDCESTAPSKTESNKVSSATIYETVPDRISKLASLVARTVRLAKLANRDKKIAFVLTNSSSKASQVGNAVGLDAPASLMLLLKSLKTAGYSIAELPENGDELIHSLLDLCSYDETFLSEKQTRSCMGKISPREYSQFFQALPLSLQATMKAQWGEPPGSAYLDSGDNLLIAGLSLGNAVVILQPPRGYGMDPNAIYHKPDLPPTHHYAAVYQWINEKFKADAVVHVGKHGTLEWLPGKGVGLSQECFPDALFGDTPLIYPFIINDPGEGTQAKRRSHAVIVDHLTPPMTTADTYGELAKLVQLVDEYYQVELLDPAKLPLLQKQIWDLVQEASLNHDLEALIGHELSEHEHEHSNEQHEHDHDHDHEHGHEHPHSHQGQLELNQEGIPSSLASMDAVKISHLIQEIDGYLCELGAAEIRGGLHILGQVPEGDALTDMLVALTRLPNLDAPSLPAAIGAYFGVNLDALLSHPGQKLDKKFSLLEDHCKRELVTASDFIEEINKLSWQLLSKLADFGFSEQSAALATESILGTETAKDTEHTKDTADIELVLSYVVRKLVPSLRATGEEINSILRALSGGFVAAGPSGAPTRGMAHILPTGRNFYSVDPRSLPSKSSWLVGKQLAEQVLSRYMKENGSYPESVSITAWGTSAMRTGGDDIAQILYLMGVEPEWQSESRRVVGLKVIELSELKRPRINVITRISGFFRDAFTHLINLIDDAVKLVIALDEPAEMNFVRKHFHLNENQLLATGISAEEASQRAVYRVFGSKPGSYGAGILGLIQEKNWKDDSDFASTYLNWGGYAYTREAGGIAAREDFATSLAAVQIAIHNQDNREHDIFDSDDYLQFHGGMIATIRSLTGRSPKQYFGDSSNPAASKVRDLKEEAYRVFRTRVVNPKWISGITQHGYKGALELASTVDYLFGYDATARIMDDWMYEQVAQEYLFKQSVREFIEKSNPWALRTISERLIEAKERGLWAAKAQTLGRLHSIFLESEALLEGRLEEEQEKYEQTKNREQGDKQIV